MQLCCASVSGERLVAMSLDRQAGMVHETSERGEDEGEGSPADGRAIGPPIAFFCERVMAKLITSGVRCRMETFNTQIGNQNTPVCRFGCILRANDTDWTVVGRLCFFELQSIVRRPRFSRPNYNLTPQPTYTLVKKSV